MRHRKNVNRRDIMAELGEISLWDSKAELDVFRCLQKVINVEEFYVFHICQFQKCFRNLESMKNLKILI